MYADAKNSLKNILDWLDGTDDAGWERQIEVGEKCRSDMERLARPIYSGVRKGDHSFGRERNPEAGKLNWAIPHVRAMLTAMRNRNRAAATCLGDLATFHKCLDLDLVLTALNEAAGDPAIALAVQDSLLCIRQFLKVQ